MKYLVHMSEKKYSAKPRNAGAASNESLQQTVEVTPQELAKAVTSGHTVVLGIMEGKLRHANKMTQQQVLMLDFDNQDEDKNRTTGDDYVSLEQILSDPFIKENASFVYTSFSHKEEHHKFRVVFFLEHIIYNHLSVTSAYEWLLAKYPQADQQIKDASRMFFGGKQAPIEVNYNNVLSLSDEVLAVKEAPKKHKAVSVQAQQKVNRKERPKTDSRIATLIRKGKKEEVKEALSVYGANVTSKPAAIDYIKTLNMMEVFGETNKTFFDYFHQEDTPSASMFILEGTNIWLYKCHSSSDDWKGDNILVVQRLLNCTYFQAVDYLIDVMDITVLDTQEVKDFKDGVDMTIQRLLSEDFKELFPHANGRFNRYKPLIASILTIFKNNHRVDENGNIRNISFYSTRTLARMVSDSESKADTIGRLLNLMHFTNWIEKLHDKDIPTDLLADLKAHQEKTGHKRHSNVYEIGDFSGNFFESLEEKCKLMKEHSFTMSGLTYETILRGFGEEEAVRVFPQEEGKKITEDSDKRVMALHEVVNKMIADQGYAVIEDVKKAMRRRFKSKAMTDIIFNRAVKEIMDAYDLKKVSLNKQLKEQFGLTKKYKPTSSPKALIPND